MFRTAALTLTLCLAAVTAQAALLSRAGGQAYYDDVLDITWLADANYAATNGFGTGWNGAMTKAGAQDWVLAMNAAQFLGASGWRLPTVEPANGTAFNYTFTSNGSSDRGYNLSAPGTIYAGSTASEFAHLFYNTLGNKSPCDPVTSFAAVCSPQAGSGLSNAGPFVGIQSYGYWTGTPYEPTPGLIWAFSFGNGNQTDDNNPDAQYAWAVHDGDPFAVVPVPAAVWLFGSALGVMGVIRRNKSEKQDA